MTAVKLRDDKGIRVPSYNELDHVMGNNAPIKVEISDTSDYEGNIEFDYLNLYYDDAVVLIEDGYFGVEEVNVPLDHLSDKGKICMSNDILEWLGDKYDYDEIDGFEV